MPKNKYALTLGQVLYTAVSLLVIPGLVLGLSGDPFWMEGWIFAAWFLGLSLAAIVFLLRHDPALLKERLSKPIRADQPAWDKAMVPAVFLLYLAWCVLMPLDAKRFHWFGKFPLWVEWVGALGLLPAAFLSYRSYTDNPFAAALVRIQKERKQKVVTTGVYGFVRHPMYLGGILMMLCTPLLLNSKAGLALGAFFPCWSACASWGRKRRC